MADYVVTIKVADDKNRTAREVREAVMTALRPLSKADAIADELYVRDITLLEVV